MGNWPPPVETCDIPEPDGPTVGKGRTNTSSRPDSPDTYEIQRPSGENEGFRLPNGLRRKGSGLPAWGCSGSLMSSGSVQRSEPVSAFCSLKATRLPSGENEYASTFLFLSSNSCASPAPSARIHWREPLVAPSDMKTICFPSCVHIGALFTP